MDDRHDIVGIIAELVRKETRFLRHYPAVVLKNEDSEKRGRILIGIPELNINTEAEGIWAFPRDKNSMSIPAVGKYVEVYFINGDPARAVYLGIASEMTYQLLKNFDGKPTTHIIFESPKTQEYIKADDIQKQLDITMSKIIFQNGTEPFVLGTQLNTFLSNLVTSINSALATKLNGSGSPGTLTPPTGILSTTIKGK